MSLPAAQQSGVPAPRSLDAATPAERKARTRAIALMCGALLCFTALDVCAKYLTRSLPVLQVTWVRYFVSAAMVLLVLNPLTVRGVFTTRKPGLQAVRSALLLASTVLNFFALQYLQLAETISIGFAMPLIVALLAGPMLGEWVGPRRFAAICVGFIGVLIITQPSAGRLNPAMLISLASMLCYALYAITTRMLAAHDSSATTLVYSSLFGALALAPVMLWQWKPPSGALEWSLLALMGLAASVGHWLLISAHRLAPAAVLSPFIYTQLLWMTGMGYLVFGDFPGSTTLTGGAIVISSGLYLLYRERVVKGG